MKPPVDFVIITALEEKRDAVLAKVKRMSYFQQPAKEHKQRKHGR